MACAGGASAVIRPPDRCASFCQARRGAFDITARIVAQRMQAELGQNVVVEKRPGGGTVIGTEFVARQPADGYIDAGCGPEFHLARRTVCSGRPRHRGSTQSVGFRRIRKRR